MITSTTVTSTVRVHGRHRWPAAPARVFYLANLHRHEFVIRVTVRVIHDDRDVEFHLLQHATRRLIDILWVRIEETDDYLFDAYSCEQISYAIGDALRTNGVDVLRVSTFEDDECGAEVSFAGLAETERRAL